MIGVNYTVIGVVAKKSRLMGEEIYLYLLQKNLLSLKKVYFVYSLTPKTLSLIL